MICSIGIEAPTSGRDIGNLFRMSSSDLGPGSVECQRRAESEQEGVAERSFSPSSCRELDHRFRRDARDQRRAIVMTL